MRGTTNSNALAVGESRFNVNPNLLDNWYFKNAVASRGSGPFTATSGVRTYTIDRWASYGDTVQYISGEGLKITCVYGNKVTRQFINNYDSLIGKEVTLSILVRSLSGKFYLSVTPYSSDSTYRCVYDHFDEEISVGLTTHTFKFQSFTALDNEIAGLGVWGKVGSTITIEAIKLELGHEQTLAHWENGGWVLNEVPNFHEERFKSHISSTDKVYDEQSCWAISYDNPRPNLLDNWCFSVSVNTRGIPNGGAYPTGYGIDRWASYSSGSSTGVGQVSWSSDGYISFSDTNNALIDQPIRNYQAIVGKMVTLTILSSQGCYTTTFKAPTASETRYGDGKLFAGSYFSSSQFGTCMMYDNIERYVCRLWHNADAGAWHVIYAVKLELGVGQTLCRWEKGQWVLNELPQRGSEEIKCRTCGADQSDSAGNQHVAYGGVVCNPNLLDNWYFGNPVNQRGSTTYTSSGYCLDRWKFAIILREGQTTYQSASITVDTSNKRIAMTNDYPTYQYIDLIQPIENYEQYSGRTATFSILTNEGFYSFQFTMNAHDGGTTCGSLRIYQTYQGYLHIRKNESSTSAGGTVYIYAVKIELGTSQTLYRWENKAWVLNQIPDYGQQLARCQRFFYSMTNCIAMGYEVVSSSGYSTIGFVINLPVAMRATPSVYVYSTISDGRKGCTLLVGGYVYDVHVTTPASVVALNGGLQLIFSGTTSSVISGYGPGFTKNLQLAISADL